MEGKVYAINFSETKGASWISVKTARVIQDFGLELDCHAGGKIKQVSLHSIEGIQKQDECVKVDSVGSLAPGDFSENITTSGIDLTCLEVGDKLEINSDVVLEISKKGKKCYKYCPDNKSEEDCIIPREAVFTKTLKGGTIAVGDCIKAVKCQ